MLSFRGMFLVRFAILLGFSGLVWASAGAQTVESPIVIEGDLRVFTAVAALNVAGFDVELGPQYHPARAEVRRIADGLDPDLVRRLREFYAARKGGRPDEEQLAKYISLAVVLTDPPELKPIAREESLPDAAREVLGFADLMREFFQKAGITRRWAAVRPSYDAEMDRMGPAIRDAIMKTDSYLRVPFGGTASQTMRISIELAAPQNSVNVRSHQENYFVVLGYAASPRTDEIRHAYLHLRLNDTVTGLFSKVEGRGLLQGLLTGEQGVERQYASSFENMLTESLVRAVELKIDREPADRATQAVRSQYRTGLLLLPYFYDALPAYESGELPLLAHLTTMIEEIDIVGERERFQQTFQSIPIPERPVVRAEIPPPPRVDPVRRLLEAAQAAFESDKPRAREAFETVLSEHNPNEGRALYGLGLIEMDAQNLEKALGYFERTVKSDSADASMIAWSYIYAGHILDFKCDREAALANYRKAIETGDNTRNAQTVAKNDLARPFGGGCPQ